MADISKIKIINGTVYDICDSQVPDLPNSNSVYLRGDGDWIVPTITLSSGVTFVDGGNGLLVYKTT